MCTRIIQHTFQGIGKTHKSQCTKPDYKDGLCKKHYDRRKEKLTNWIDRVGYREATQHDLDTGRSLKLKNEHTHRLFICRKDIIKEYNSNQSKYLEINIPADFKLFCVRDL